MNIISVIYLAFVAAVVAGYYITPRRFRWVTLLLASAVYYLVYDVKLSVLLLLSSLSIYCGGLLIQRREGKYLASLDNAELDRAAKKALKKRNSRAKTRIAVLVALFNIAIWVLFKFTGILVTMFNRLFSTDYGLISLGIPLGISFYTLQAVSYVVDVSRGKCEAQKNFFKLALWLGFFPQMLQGPICRYSETAEQLFQPHDFDYRSFKFGIQSMIWGYFKKLVVANRASTISATIFGNSGKYEGVVFLIGALAYTIQIYADFSGGMDIIYGVSEMVGIHMPKNFERPYFSRSVAEYWRRWHITLGGWFRDYVFYPLSISKAAQWLGKHCRKVFGAKLGKMIPTYLAMVIVWTLNGIWHGAGKQFAVYGFYQGILIVLGMQTETLNQWLFDKLRVNTDCFSWRLWQRLRTFGLMVWGRILFKASGLREAFRIWGSVITVRNPWVLTDGTVFTFGLDAWEMFVLFLGILVMFSVSLMQEKGIHLREAIERQNLVFRWALYILAIFAVILLGVYGTKYNAADFIYAGF